MQAQQRIVLIDDDPIINMVHKAIIHSINKKYELFVFDNAISSLEYFENEGHSSDSKYLVFLDINMPRMNAWQFLDKVIESQLHKKHELYICIVSSSISSQDKARSMQYEIVNQFISKPLMVEKVIEILQTAFGEQ